MKVKELTITGFGKFTGETFKFNDSINIIKGLNEAGKTTLVNAILGALYGFKGRSDEMRLLKERYRPWDTSIPFQVSMKVNFGDPFDYIINRDFESDDVTFVKLNNGTKQPVANSAKEFLSEKIGLSSWKLFKSTLLIKQDEVADLHQTEVSDALIRKLTESGAGVTVKEINQILSQRLKQLYKGFGRQTANPGPIRACMKEIGDLEKEISELSESYGEYNHIISELKKIEYERQKVETRINEITPQVEGFQKNQNFALRLEQAKEELKQLENLKEKITTKENELNEVDNHLQEFQPFENILSTETLQELEFLDRKVNVTEQRFEQVNYEYQKLKNKRQLVQREMGNHSKTIAVYYSVRYNEKNLLEAKRLQVAIGNIKEELKEKEERLSQLAAEKKGRFTWTFWLGLFLCLISVIGVISTNRWGYVAASIFFVSGIITIYLGGMKSRHNLTKELVKITESDVQRLQANQEAYQKMLEGIIVDENVNSFEEKVKEQMQLKQKIQHLEEELNALELEPFETEIECLRNDLNTYLKKIRRILADANAESIENFRERLEKNKELHAKRNLLLDTLQFLKEDIKSSNIDNEITSLQLEIGKLEDILQNSKRVTEQKYNDLNNELKELKKSLEEIKNQEIKTAASADNFKKLVLQKRDIWSLEMALAEKKEQLKALELEGKGIDLAVKMINESLEEARSKLAPQVKDKLLKIFRWVTQNRYNDIKFDIEGNGFSFQFVDGTFGQYRDLHHLSTGTRDQLYLALRIALGEYLTKSKTFPLFLDDPFVNFDNERLIKALEILQILAREHQVIWLTKDDTLLENIPEAAVTELV